MLTSGRGGYEELLADRAHLDALWADRWLDKQTVAVAVTFNAYNTNTKLLTVARVFFKFSNTGRIEKVGRARAIEGSEL